MAGATFLIDDRPTEACAHDVRPPPRVKHGAALRYAVGVVPNRTFQVYEVEFRLTAPPPTPGAETP